LYHTAIRSFPGVRLAGLLQFDLWGAEPSGRWKWPELKAKIAEKGLRTDFFKGRNHYRVKYMCYYVLLILVKYIEMV
jgi:hypothetical protein